MKTFARLSLLTGAATAALLSVSLALAPKKNAATAPTADFVAHEWGTFTSVQGADGVQFEWNPFVAPELPKFVYNIANPTGRAGALVLPSFYSPGKTGMTSRQRMETPVIYFYSEKERSVDVDVQFPDGRITEWYPQLTNPKAQAAAPGRDAAGFFATRAAMHWTDVQLRPGADESKLYPSDATGSHYYAARETDSVPLRVKAADGTEQHEKFLFYRGVAQFEAPLNVTQYGENAEIVMLTNHAKQPLGALFIYSVRGDRAALMPLANLKTDETRRVDPDFDKLARPLAEVRADIAAKMRAALVAEGLYEKEAAAMVKTWDDSWFAEPGTRVLYTLPQKWTDGILPLNLTPAPKEIRRVFVGRAEMITPAMEWAVLREVVRYADGDDTAKAASVKTVQSLGLGRFTEPAMRRISDRGPQAAAFRNAAYALLEATRPAKPQPLAKAE